MKVSWLIVKKTHRLCYIHSPDANGVVISWDEEHTKGLNGIEDIKSKDSNYVETTVRFK